MTAVSKNLYFIVLIDIFNKYNDVFHRTIKIKKTVPWTYVINNLNGEESFGTFY